MRWWLTPGWLARHAGIAVLFAATIALGLWQLDRTLAVHRASQRPLPAPTPVSLATALPSGGPVTQDQLGRVVDVTGVADRQHVLWVPTSSAGSGAARVTWAAAVPIRVTEGPLSGRRVVASLGAASNPAEVADLPSSPVRFRGWLSPADVTAGGAGGSANRPPAPGTVVDALDPAVLVNVLPYPVVDGVLHVTSPRLAGLTADARPVQRSSGRWPLQNAAYAVQWWVFGVAGLWWWGRVLREEGASRRGRAVEGAEGALAGGGVGDDPALGEERRERDGAGERDEDRLEDRPPLLQ